MKRMAAVFLLGVLSACAKPSDGPTPYDIGNATLPGTSERIPVIELANAPVQSPALQAQANTFSPGLAALRGGNYNAQRLRPGDTIEVNVLDTGEQGLFSSTESKSLNMGRFTVDQGGSVTMPFVGKQHVAGSTPEAVQSRIVSGLKGSAVNPQAVVTIVDKPSSAVTVGGAVRTPGRVPLTARQERVLDVVNQSGGSTVAPGAATVTVIRGHQRASATLDRIMRDDRQNIRLLPDDQVLIDGDAATFTALGAFKSTGEFKFETGKLTLAQAIGRAGGLLDDTADAHNVYVFRNNVVVPDGMTSGTTVATAAATSMRPVIYHVDMVDAASIALMQLFQVEKGDVIYVTNASSVDAAKTFTVFQKSPPLPAAPSPPSLN